MAVSILISVIKLVESMTIGRFYKSIQIYKSLLTQRNDLTQWPDLSVPGISWPVGRPDLRNKTAASGVASS